MNRTTVLGGLAVTLAALAITAPAHAQEFIPPAQPSTPTGQPSTPVVPPAQPSTPTGTPSTPVVPPAQPSSPNVTIGFGQKCVVARSSHGYTYAVCSVQADNVPSGQTVSISYRSNLHTFKPRTNVKWGSTTGAISLSNDSVSGGPSNVTTGVKLAFKDMTVAQVRRELIVGATGSNGAGIIQPIAAG